jgi:hypothetical protein
MEGSSCSGPFSIAVPHDKTVTRTSAGDAAQAAGTYTQNGDTGTCRAYPASTRALLYNSLILKFNFLRRIDA